MIEQSLEPHLRWGKITTIDTEGNQRWNQSQSVSGWTEWRLLLMLFDGVFSVGKWGQSAPSAEFPRCWNFSLGTGQAAPIFLHLRSIASIGAGGVERCQPIGSELCALPPADQSGGRPELEFAQSIPYCYPMNAFVPERDSSGRPLTDQASCN